MLRYWKIRKQTNENEILSIYRQKSTRSRTYSTSSTSESSTFFESGVFVCTCLDSSFCRWLSESIDGNLQCEPSMRQCGNRTTSNRYTVMQIYWEYRNLHRCPFILDLRSQILVSKIHCKVLHAVQLKQFLLSRSHYQRTWTHKNYTFELICRYFSRKTFKRSKYFSAPFENNRKITANLSNYNKHSHLYWHANFSISDCVCLWLCLYLYQCLCYDIDIDTDKDTVIDRQSLILTETLTQNIDTDKETVIDTDSIIDNDTDIDIGYRHR